MGDSGMFVSEKSGKRALFIYKFLKIYGKYTTIFVGMGHLLCTQNYALRGYNK